MPSSSIDLPLSRRFPKSHGWMTGVLICVLLVATTVCSVSGSACAQGAHSAVDCAIQSGPCTKDLLGGRVSLDIVPKPVKAMCDLTFTVTFSGVKPANDPFIDLGMPGMVMGPNRVKLRPVAEGLYQGTGVIVRCPSGRRTWNAAVTLPDQGVVEFVFDVVY